MRTFGLALIAILLMQTAWALVTPPFRGLDEHEHAFKAAAVARGDWGVSHPAAPSGWGELMAVPTDLALAARPVCGELNVGENCDPQPTSQPGISLVGTSAARYNPLFYAVIGTVSRPFHGTVALYAMRATGALMCAALLAFAFLTIRRWSTSLWMPAAFLVAVTPITVYSTSIASPNGLELSAAILVWSALLGVTRLPAGSANVDRFVVAAAVGAVPLMIVRTLGPLWLLLILASCALLMPRERLRALLRRRSSRIGALVVIALGSFGPTWTLLAHTNSIASSESRQTGLWSDLPVQWVLWFLQSVAAFPARNELAPLFVYAIAFAVMWVGVAPAVKLARRRERLVLLGIVAMTTAVAAGVSIAAYAHAGPVWQGRYGYPYAVGFFLLCGAVLDARAARGRVPVVALFSALALTVVLELVSLLHVLHAQLATSVLAGTDEWPAPSDVLVVALVVASAIGCLLASQTSVGAPAETTAPPSPQRELAATHRSSVA